MSMIQSFARQIFQGISFMHDKLRLTHTDLKPENLLLEINSFSTVKNIEQFPKNVIKKENLLNKKASPSTEGNSSENFKYNIPSSSEIKIIDFGGATYHNESHTEIINTRQYRAPEVILGCCQWNEKSDIWSIACILIELYTGELYFPTHDNNEHLCLIEKAVGNFPYWMVDNSRKEFKDIFELVDNNNYYNKPRCKINYYKMKDRKEIEHAVNKLEILKDLVCAEHNLFKSFLEYIFVIDPDKRPTSSEALKHEFFNYDFSNLY